MANSPLWQENLARWSLFYPNAAESLSGVQPSHYPEDSLEAAKQTFQDYLKTNPHLRVLFIYGVGSGIYYEAAKQWLKGHPRRALIFLEEDLGVIQQLMSTSEGKEILNDEQVWLHYYDESPKGDADFESLMKNFAFHNPLDAIAHSHYLKTKNDRFKTLRMRILHQANIYDNIANEYSNGGVHFFLNYFHNMLWIPRAYLGDSLFGKFKNMPAIVCGAGPSLEKNAHILKQLEDRAIIFAGGTALNALNAMGISAHFGIGIDPNLTYIARMIMNQAFEIPFLYRSRMSFRALEFAHGDRLFITGGGGYETSHWFQKKMGIDSDPIEEGNNVVNFSLSLAHALGCNPIICVGVDLAYSDNKPYPSGIPFHALHDPNYEFQSKSSEEELLIKNDIFGKPVVTLWKWVIESLWYSRFSLKHPEISIINATEGGIGFPSIPNIPLKDVADQYLTKEYDIEGLIHTHIQSSQMPKQITVDEIKKLCHEFGDNMKLCEEGYREILADLTKIKEEIVKGNLPAEIIPPKIAERIEKLQNEDAYKYLLGVFDRTFEFVRHRDYLRLRTERDKLSPQEHALKTIEIALNRYSYLGQTIHLNYHLMMDIIEHSQVPVPLPAPVIKPLPVGEPGATIRTYASGALHSIRRSKDKKKEGLQEYFYQDGTSKSQIPYKEGKLDGTVRLYHPNNQLARELGFKNGKRQGKEHCWDQQGMMLVDAEYDQDRPIGYSRQWYPNGNMAKEIIFDENSHPVKVREWNEFGAPVMTAREVHHDYFDDVNTKTKVVTKNLESVMKNIKNLIPLVADKAEFSSQLQEIEKQLATLKHLQSEMVFQSGADPTRPKEAIWKSPSNRTLIQDSLNQFSQLMSKQIQQIEIALENLKNQAKG